MCSPPKTLCAKCFKSLQSDKFVKCYICNSKFHLFCSGIDEQPAYGVLKKNKNIVFNCDDCFSISNDLVSAVCSLSNELRELKSSVNEMLRRNSNIANDLGASTSRGHSTRPLSTVTAANAAVNDVTSKNNDMNQTPIIMSEYVLDKTMVAKDFVVAEHTNAVVVGSNVRTEHNSNSTSVDHASMTSAETGMHDAISLPASHADVNSNPAHISDWVAVNRRKKNNRMFVIGKNSTNELDVIARRKWVHISSFKPTVTEDQILSYVEKSIDIARNHLLCRKLVKKDANVDEIRRVSFKLGISADFYSMLFKPEIWPSDVKVRPFQFFQRNQKAPE